MTGVELTDEEWREFQAIPEQGYSHRAWVDRKIAARLASPHECEGQRQLAALVDPLAHMARVRTESAEARAEAALAEVARLTAEKDKIGDANCAVKMRLQLQVEALTALVEAGLGLADKWEQLANLAYGTVAVPIALRAHAQELRAALSGAK